MKLKNILKNNATLIITIFLALTIAILSAKCMLSSNKDYLSIIKSHSSNTVSQPKIAYTSAAANSSQLITVVSTGGSSAELTLWQKDSSGNWFEYDSMFARLGSGGMKSASLVYEMDMCTPTGIYSLSEAFGINSNPGSGLPYRVLDGSEYWVDDENSPYYNTMQFGEPNGR